MLGLRHTRILLLYLWAVEAGTVEGAEVMATLEADEKDNSHKSDASG